MLSIIGNHSINYRQNETSNLEDSGVVAPNPISTLNINYRLFVSNNIEVNR